jgi:peptide/nickel transport system permease protein
MSQHQLDSRTAQGADELTAVPTLAAVAPDVSVAGGGRRFRDNLGLWLCFGWLAVVVVCALAASRLPGVRAPNVIDPFNRLKGPSRAHWFGTDEIGRDIFSRVVYGARVSVVVAVVSLAIGLIVGGSFGLVAGYFRGRIERTVIWGTDVLLSFPALVMLIALVAYTGRSLAHISLAIGFLAIPVYTRLARAYALNTSGEEFVTAARASGASRLRVLWREVVPNVAPSMLAYGFIAMSLTIVVEGTLSFLGLSVSAPTPSWGGLIADGQHYLREASTMVIIPSVVLCVTVLALNLAGETLRRRYEEGGG